MGEIVKEFRAKSTTKERGRPLRFYFDNGSPWTFVKFSSVHSMRELTPLSENAVFHGMGNGAFRATHTIRLYIHMKGVWVPFLCYVVPDEIMGRRYDAIIGHDFMQVYDIKLAPRQHRAVIDKDALLHALVVR